MTACATAETPETMSPEAQELMERHFAFGEAYQKFLSDTIAANGQVDRVVFRELLATYGQLRRDLLIACGEDPDDPATAELMPFPAELMSS